MNEEKPKPYGYKYFPAKANINKNRKIVSFSNIRYDLVVLCDDGSLWTSATDDNGDPCWAAFPDIPKIEEES